MIDGSAIYASCQMLELAYTSAGLLKGLGLCAGQAASTIGS
jgi:hypothetical protein